MRTFILFLSCLIFSAGMGQSLSDSLVLYYPFDGNPADLGPYQLDGITNATFTEDRFGNPEGAIHFNGIDQYLDFPPNKPVLKPPLPVSFAFWIRFEDDVPIVTQIFTTDYDQNNHTGVFISNTAYGAIACSYGDGTQACTINNRQSKLCETVLNSNTWYFLIAIVNGASDMHVYLNCTEENGVYEGYGDSLAYTDCQGSLGRKDTQHAGPPDYFLGAIDDFRYWSRALTPADIDSLCAMVNMKEFPPKPDLSFSLYPNPASDILTLANIPKQAVRFELIEPFGKIIQSCPVMEKLDIHEFSPGIYFLRVISQENEILAREKFIKQ